uniref:hypothetical protein n=1 Tax=Roseivirga sp. TaxID=1964215 RepID=UPI0040479120
MDLLHQGNIITHVLTGTVGLLLGLICLLSLKGGKIHNKAGKLFLVFISVVILTGFFGVFVFKRNTFLLVITVLAGYVSFSGFRTLIRKTNKANTIDIIIAIFTLLVLAYFLNYFKSIGMIWSPIVIYSTVGALLVVILYDFGRYFIPKTYYIKNKLWLHEHIYKMTSAFSALLSAFTGTVLEVYQPHSQYLPSVLGMIIIIGFMIYVSKKGILKYRKKPSINIP